MISHSCECGQNIPLPHDALNYVASMYKGRMNQNNVKQLSTTVLANFGHFTEKL